MEDSDLVDHVQVLLNCGDHLSTIATFLGLSKDGLSRGLYNLRWRGIYYNLTIEECREAILSVVP